MDQQFMQEWTRLRTEHTHDRDAANNYGCFNVETCRNCAYCVGLNGARSHILNKEHSEQDYYARLTERGVNWKVEAFDPMDPYSAIE